MEIQWPLVAFTVMAGAGGWLLAFVGINEFTGKITNKKIRLRSLIAALVLVVLGGCASVLHLSHPDRIMGALSHPTSGIFTEALMVGLVALAIIVYLMACKREVSQRGIKICAAIALVLGVILSYATGSSYMMASQPAWNTLLLPLGYMTTSAVAGGALYLSFVAINNEEKAGITCMAWCTCVAGLVALVVTTAYGVVSNGFVASEETLVILCVNLAGLLVATGAAYLANKKDFTLVLAVLAVVGAVVGSFAFRCLMWVMGTGILNFFGSNFFGMI